MRIVGAVLRQLLAGEPVDQAQVLVCVDQVGCPELAERADGVGGRQRERCVIALGDVRGGDGDFGF